MTRRQRITGVARKLGSLEEMKASYQSMFSGITDNEAMELLTVFLSGNNEAYQRKLSEAKQKYHYSEPELFFTDGLPEWDI